MSDEVTQPNGPSDSSKDVIAAADASDAIEGTQDFGAWVAPHLARMALVAARLGGPSERDDIVQEALVRAWRKRGQFDERRGSPSAWLCAITANVARSSKRVSLPFGLRQPRNESADREGAMDLDAAIARLPPRQRLAIECHYAIGLTTTESAAVMGCSEGTVVDAVRRAREPPSPAVV
jgi:RNA polymerase sigma factor (sigma-70 family)